MAKKLAEHGRRWFAFLLCRTVNTGFGLDVNRLLEETPTELFEEWRTLYGMEPWGDERADYAAGTIIAAVKKDEGQIISVAKKYMPFLKKEKPKRQSETDMKRTADAICRAIKNNDNKPE